MKVDKETVEHIATLARLELREEEKEQLTGHFNRILTYIEQLNELDGELEAGSIEPLAQLVPHTNAFREDEVSPSLSAADALKNAPQRMENFIAVPKVIG